MDQRNLKWDFWKTLRWVFHRIFVEKILNLKVFFINVGSQIVKDFLNTVSAEDWAFFMSLWTILKLRHRLLRMSTFWQKWSCINLYQGQKVHIFRERLFYSYSTFLPKLASKSTIPARKMQFIYWKNPA